MKIFINPGHAPNGDPDPGAVNSITGLRESDVVKIVGDKVSQYLQAVGLEVYSLQSDSLAEVCDTSNNWPADLFISIHCNAYIYDTAEGTETYCYSLSNEDYSLAKNIQDQITSSLHTSNRGIKEANFYVLRHTACPAVLVELAFISNTDDEKILSSAKYQDKFARAIAHGVTSYLMTK
ncbi:N-acetylmuramoyl-L-alanine amidase [Selenomonadales bacterium OttesenSCG-928-I06]|nr:N-acetylmuramoyl-L-alanine amidase [Selenomonadales bacterium OttesenSCG-928-I06]